MFVLLRIEDYERLLEEEYGNSPPTYEEFQALAWGRLKHKVGVWCNAILKRLLPHL